VDTQNNALLTGVGGTAVEVSVYCHGFLLSRGQLTQLGPLGLSLAWPGVKPSHHLYLEVQFSLATPDGQRDFRLPVYMGRFGKGQLELLFVGYEERPIARLQDTLAELT